MHLLRGIVSGLLLAGAVAAKPPLHTIVVQVSSDVAAGSALHVAVDRPELNMLTTTGSVRMFTAGASQWTGRFAVQGSVVATTVPYRFTARTTNSGAYCTLANGNLGGTAYVTNLPAWNPGYSGKTIYYHSTWSNVAVLYRADASNWLFSPPMTRLGLGRNAGESRYMVTGIGEPGRPLEFVLRGFLNGVEQWDNPAVGGVNNNYYTSLDVFFLQDKNIFNYEPPATVSAPQVINVGSWNSSYTGNGIPTRGGRIYLPRGYTQNTGKRYPVLYMHDGQNVFDPGGAFGSWSADAAATREIAQGRMRETIIVAVNNTGSRLTEYGTPQDGYTGNYYLMYLVNNVQPSIDATYRTLTNLMDTGVMGSSLGGLISAYCGLSTNRFGLIGAVSPSYWYGPNFRSWINAQATAGRRIWQCAGTSEGADMWDYFWPVYGYYLQDGYVVGDSLRIALGCGEGHNEAAWAKRVGGAFQFLFNPWDEVNALDTNVPPPPPPDLVITNPPGPLAVGELVDAVTLQGTANTAIWQGLRWTNHLTGGSGAAPIAAAWSIAGIPLGHGTNVIAVTATNTTPVLITHAQDAASDPAYGGGWTNGSNGGSGFGAWSLAADAAAGLFVNGERWGLWSQSNNLAQAVRPIAAALESGRRFRFTWQNGFVVEGRQSIGFALRDAGGTPRIQFYFNGGDTNYTVEDAAGARSTGVGWTDAPQTVEIEVLTATTYVMRVGATVVNGTFAGPLMQFRFWSWSGGVGSNYDFFFSGLQVYEIGAGGSATSVATTVTRALPAVHDGIPLSWWNAAGLGTNSTGEADSDGDGTSNREEYIADTHPTNPASLYPQRTQAVSGGDVLWLTVGPPTTNSRRYDIWHTTSLLHGAWSPIQLNWPGAANGAALQLPVTNQGEARYYRTSVALP